MRKLFSIIIGLSLNLAAQAYAQSPDCDAALIKRTISSISSMRIKLAILKTIDEYNFEQNKQRGNISMLIPDADLPVRASYQKFNEKRNDLLKRYSYNFEQDESRNFFMSTLLPTSVEAYIACLQVANFGFYYYFANVREDSPAVTLVIRFKPPVAGRARTESAQFSGIVTPTSVIKKSWGPGSDGQNVILQRMTPLEPLSAAINISGYPSTPASVPLPPVLKQIVYKWVPVGRGDLWGHDIACSDGPKPENSSCQPDIVGKRTAVCFPNGINPRPLPGCTNRQNWCTYKDQPPNKVVAGSVSSADKYDCRAVGEEIVR